MPRAPRTAADSRRRQLIEAALPVFAARSYAEATTQEIATAAGVSQATVFKYFPTKRELFVAVLAWTTDLVLAKWRAAAAGTDTPLESLRAIARAYADMAHTEQTTFRVRIRALANSGDPVIAEAVRQSFLAVAAYLEALIAQAQSAGELPETTHPRTAAWHFVSVGQGFHLNHFAGFQWEPAVLEGLIQGLFRAMEG